MHEVAGADNSVDGAGVAAMKAANTTRLVDYRNRGIQDCLERQHVAPQSSGKPAYRRVAARWAKIDWSVMLDDCSGIGTTPGKSTLCTLRLWQQLVDLFNKVGALARELSRRQA